MYHEMIWIVRKVYLSHKHTAKAHNCAVSSEPSLIPHALKLNHYWQNQQNDLCAQQCLISARASTQSDQSLHCALYGWQSPTASSCGQWRQIRLGGCPGWSESSLDAQVILLVLSCCGSIYMELVEATNKKPHLLNGIEYEPHHEKTCLRGLQPGKTQTGLLCFRS